MYVFTICFLISLFFFSCKKIERNSNQKNLESELPQIKTAGRTLNTIGQNLNKIPVFSSIEEFISLADSLSMLNTSQFAQFETNNNFKSMHTCFEEIVTAENQIATNLENAGQTNPAVFDNTHSPLFSTYSGCYFVKTMSDGGLFLEINSPLSKFAYAMNFQGFVRISNVLYNITDDTVKTMINGTEANAAAIRIASAPSSNISVAKFEDNIGSSTPSFLRLMSQSWKESGMHNNGRLRNITYQNFNIYEKSNPSSNIRTSPFTG
jgi:hypothetical protein